MGNESSLFIISTTSSPYFLLFFLRAPHLALGDLGDDLVSHFYRWKHSAEKNDGALPYFSKWDGKSLNFKAAVTDNEVSQDTQFAVVDDGERVDGENVGTYGILKSYSQKATTELYPPVNYKMYKPLLDMDQAFRSDAPDPPLFSAGRARAHDALVQGRPACLLPRPGREPTPRLN